MRRIAFSPLSRLRTARTTRAPLAARAAAVSYPSPVLAPVTIAVRPHWSGMSATVHFAHESPFMVSRRRLAAGSTQRADDQDSYPATASRSEPQVHSGEYEPENEAIAFEGTSEKQRRVAQFHEIQSDIADFDQRQRQNPQGDSRTDAVVGADRERHQRDDDQTQPDDGGSGAK